MTSVSTAKSGLGWHLWPNASIPIHTHFEYFGHEYSKSKSITGVQR